MRVQFVGIADQWIGQIGCSEYRTLLIQIEDALDVAKARGVPTDNPAYVRAAKQITIESGIMTRSTLVLGADCRNAVSYATKLLTDLNAAIQQVSGTPNPYAPFVPEVGNGLDRIMDVLKWVALGGGVIALAYVAGPAIRSISGPRRRALKA